MMKWMSMLLAASLLACAADDGSAPRGPRSELQGFDGRGDEASVVFVAQADYERLFDAAIAVVEPFRISEEDRPGGRILSADFGRVEQGVPRYRYIEVRLARADETGGRYKVGVAVYLYQKRFPDGSPVGRDDERYEWVYQGLDREAQDEMAEAIFRRYLEGR